MLDVKNMSINYGKHRALDEVSLNVGLAECVVILGANGAGKSSLLKGITSMVRVVPDSEIKYLGKSIMHCAAHEIVELGIAHVPEGRGVFTEMSVYENLILGSNPKRSKVGIEGRMERVLNLFPKLNERKGQIVGTMSGGEQQMVAIARSLMSHPELLLLDEPSLGLAPIVVSELFKALGQIKKLGVSLLIVEQNVKISLSIADRGYLLEAGRIVGSDSAKNLLNDPAVQEAFLGHS